MTRFGKGTTEESFCVSIKILVQGGEDVRREKGGTSPLRPHNYSAQSGFISQRQGELVTDGPDQKKHLDRDGVVPVVKIWTRRVKDRQKGQGAGNVPRRSKLL